MRPLTSPLHDILDTAPTPAIVIAISCVISLLRAYPPGISSWEYPPGRGISYIERNATAEQMMPKKKGREKQRRSEEYWLYVLRNPINSALERASRNYPLSCHVD